MLKKTFLSIVIVSLFFATTTTRLFGTRLYCGVPKPANAERHRCAQLHKSVFINTAGQPKSLVGADIPMNFFGNVVYKARVDASYPDSGGYVWAGHLVGMENSYFFVIYTSGVFMVHAGSPLGIYEASYLRPGVYRIIKLKQFVPAD